jgi:hypothetical protein
MTGQEFRDYVVRKFKRTDKDTELYEATTDIIADMRIQFNSEDFKEETYSSGITSIGEYKLGLPSDFGSIIGDISIIDTNTDEDYPVLKKISKQRYDELYPERLLTDTGKMDTGTPEHFCIYANQVFVGPVPDYTTYRYQFNYSTEPTEEITSTTDSVPFTGYSERNTTRSGVLMELYDGMENYEESGVWERKYLTGLSKIAINDEDNIKDEDLAVYNGI